MAACLERKLAAVPNKLCLSDLEYSESEEWFILILRMSFPKYFYHSILPGFFYRITFPSTKPSFGLRINLLNLLPAVVFPLLFLGGRVSQFFKNVNIK